MRRTLLALSLVALCSTALAAQASSDSVARHSTLGLGFQTSFPSYGISAVLNTRTPIAVQAIVGAFADVKMYSGRVLYRFPEHSQLRPFLFGTAGVWSYEGTRIDESGVGTTTETAPGFGAGAGLQYHTAGLPNLVWSLDAGFASVKFTEVDYKLSTTSLGLGIHYFFK